MTDTATVLATDVDVDVAMANHDADVAYAVRVISARRQRTVQSDWRGRPYAVWHREERAFAWLRAISATMSDVPHARHAHARTWNWTSYLNGGRLAMRATSDTMIDGERAITAKWQHVPTRDGGETPYAVCQTTVPASAPGATSRVASRDVGPNDLHGGLWRTWERPTVTPCHVGIVFPSDVAVTSASPVRRTVPAERQRHPLADVYGARLAHGWHGSPFADIPPIAPSVMARAIGSLT